MSAQPNFREFRDASARRDHDLQDGWHTTVNRLDSFSAWDEVAAQNDDQENWHYSRPGLGHADSSSTGDYPRVLRMAVIGVLSLLSWAMVVAAWQGVAHMMR